MTVPAEYQMATEEFYSFLLDARNGANLWSTHAAYTMAQGVFQVFRRRLSVEQSLAFANILPIGLRALFVADWDINEPRKKFSDIKTMTYEVGTLRNNHNYSTSTAIKDIAVALRKNVDEKKLDELLKTFPVEAREFWNIQGGPI